MPNRVGFSGTGHRPGRHGCCSMQTCRLCLEGKVNFRLHKLSKAIENNQECLVLFTMSKAHEILTYQSMNLKGKFEFTVHEQSFLGLRTILFKIKFFSLQKNQTLFLDVYLLSIRIGKTQNRTRKIYLSKSRLFTTSQLSFNVVICYSY